MIVTGTKPTHGKPPTLEVCMLKQTLLILILVSISLSQNLVKGQVFDNYGKPLSYASIIDLKNQNWITSDEFGYFAKYFNLKQGDSLQIRRYGYQNKVIILNDKSFYSIQ